MELNKKQRQISHKARIRNWELSRNGGPEPRIRRRWDPRQLLSPPVAWGHWVFVCKPHRKPWSPADGLCPCPARAGPALLQPQHLHLKQRLAVICALIPATGVQHRCTWCRGCQVRINPCADFLSFKLTANCHCKQKHKNVLLHHKASFWFSCWWNSRVC